MAEFSVADLAQAKAAVGALLEGLGLSAHIFAVEPRAGAWAVIVECATDSGWQRTELQAGAELLGASLRDPAAKAALLDQWRTHLAACKTD
ncbi:MAG: hypothetical protein AB1710_00795 [Pseudomonadota bacterium]|jgi:hypothetical protein